jgi:mono/diheme cytochrome c family protein
MSLDRKSPALWQSPALTGACALLLALTASAQSVPPDHAKQMAAGLELFKSSVRQLLKEHCLECHGGSSKVKSDFDLATREGLLKGGAEGKAIVVGNASQSRLVKLVSHAAEPHMPSKKPRLPDDAIRQISQWIDLGAPYDQPLIANAKVVKDRSVVTEADKQFWSFQPLKPVEPPSLKSLKNRSWARTPVDRFILAELEKKRLTPNPPLDRRKLIRRVYFDLIGLPPTPEEVDAFVGDKSPRAYEELIDRLLASSHYGERWGRHWLDLARYGESHGYEQDYDRPFAYHYRDFVIRALNDDLPYDKFVQWQIAGDELAPDNPQAWFATGFLGAGTHATQITANQAEKERYDELDDKISTIGTAMLGLTIGCARCHDHKFDPITAKDYYALISTFTTTVRSDHDVDLDPARTRRLMAEFNARHQPLVEALDRFEKEQLPARVEHWLKSNPSLPQPEWLVLELEGFRASGGYYGINSSKRLDDGSWLVSITAGSPDRINFTVKTTLTNLAALRFEALPHKSLPNHGPGWSKDGGFQLTGLTVTARPLKGGGQPQVLAFTKKRSLTEAKGVEAKLPWSSGGKSGGEQVAVYELEKPAGLAEGAELAFTLSFDSNFDRNLIGRLRVSASASTSTALKTPAHVFAKDYETALATLGGDTDKWKKEQREALARVHRAMDADWLKLKAAILDHERQEPRPQLVKAMVCSEGLPAIRLHTQGPDFYERTYLLRRGDLAQKQGEASQSFLQVLMRTSEKEKHWQRAGPAGATNAPLRSTMAHWITDVDHGAGHLLARVMV